MLGLGRGAVGAKRLNLIHAEFTGHAQRVFKAATDQGQAKTQSRDGCRLNLIGWTRELQSISADQRRLPERSAAIDHVNGVPNAATQHPSQVVLFGAFQRDAWIAGLNSCQTLGCNQQPSPLSHLTGKDCRGDPPQANPR